MNDQAQICSQCGWAFTHEALQRSECKMCGSAILVTSIAYLEKFDTPAVKKYIDQYARVLKVDSDDRDALLALGICYLKLSLFDLADRFLMRMIESHPADSSGYFYRAISLLKGRRPRIVTMSQIREIERLLTTAVELDSSNGRYELVLAAIRYDYYVFNGLRVPLPSPAELEISAAQKYIDHLELRHVFQMICVSNEATMSYLVS